MPKQNRRPTCGYSNPTLHSTPGPTGHNDSADVNRPILLPISPRSLGVFDSMANGATVLAQAGGKPAVTLTAKRLRMPGPASDGRTKKARAYILPLYAGAPKYLDINQGNINDCFLASIIGALANTVNGRRKIVSLIKEHQARVESDVSTAESDLARDAVGKMIKSDRYFSVTIGGKSYEVSNVLYTDDGDKNWGLKYMQIPKNVLWGCIIEKAFAKKNGSYLGLDIQSSRGNPISVNDTWKQLCGAAPKVFVVNAKTSHRKIVAAAKTAGTVSTIAVGGFHSVAILGYKKK